MWVAQLLPLIFIPLMILNSVDQNVRLNEAGRGGWAGTGKKGELSLSQHVIWLLFGLSSSRRVHRQELTLKLSFTNYLELMGCKTILHISACISQFCHSAMQKRLNVHGIHNNSSWILHWTMGISEHPRHCSGLKSLGPYSCKPEPVGWISRRNSNGNEPQKMREPKSQAPFQARDF